MAAMTDQLKSDNVHRSMQHKLVHVADVLANIATIDAIEVRSASLGSFAVPTGATYVTLTFYVSYDGVTYVQLHDAAGVAISRTVAAARAYPLPTEVFGFTWLKIVSNVIGNIGVGLKG